MSEQRAAMPTIIGFEGSANKVSPVHVCVACDRGGACASVLVFAPRHTCLDADGYLAELV